MRYFIEKGVPALGYGPYGENIHGDNEFVSLDSMVNTTKIFADLIMRL